MTPLPCPVEIGAQQLIADLHRRMDALMFHGSTETHFVGPTNQACPIIEPATTRGQELVALLRGSLGPGSFTDEIMAMTRGED